MRVLTALAISIFFIFGSFGLQAKAYLDVPYGLHEKQKLDIYTPEVVGANLPVHIFVHGGAWNFGDKNTVKKKDAGAYTSHGVILVSLNYRLSPSFKHPTHVSDLAQAVKWMFDNIPQYGGDKSNMVLSGHSAGAHLVALLATDAKHLEEQGLKQNLFAAVIPVDSASYDLTSSQGSVVTRFIKKAFGEKQGNLRRASPIYNIDSRDVLSPFNVFITADRSRAVLDSTNFVEKLRENGKRHKLSIIKDASHSEMKRLIFESDSQIFKSIIRHLKDR